jgi:hypothetical protein
MNESPSKLWLRSYSGKENGLMVVGTPESLKSLGVQLQTAGDFMNESSKDWPSEVASPIVSGPYKDIPDFQLTFHIAGNAPISKATPLVRRNMPAPLFVIIAVCAVVGALTIFRWVVSYAS